MERSGSGHVGAPGTLPPDLLTFAHALRTNQTDAETKLWWLLKDRRLRSMKFRRQHPIPPYVVDFYCHDAHLVIEVDGGQHSEARRYDEERTAFLGSLGIRVMRFWNNEVLQSTDAVLEAIWRELHPQSA